MDAADRAKPRPGRRRQDVADWRASPAGRRTKILWILSGQKTFGFPHGQKIAGLEGRPIRHVEVCFGNWGSMAGAPKTATYRVKTAEMRPSGWTLSESTGIFRLIPADKMPTFPP
jgi:hypothetical protein